MIKEGRSGDDTSLVKQWRGMGGGGGTTELIKLVIELSSQIKAGAVDYRFLLLSSSLLLLIFV